MRLNEILEGAVNLDAEENPYLLRVLRKGDKALFEGREVKVATPLRKSTKAFWVMTVESKAGREKVYVRDIKTVRMTPKEKKVMKENVKVNLKNFDGLTNRLTGMAKAYYYNLVEHNNYHPDDVKEVMNCFGTELIKGSGIRIP